MVIKSVDLEIVLGTTSQLPTTALCELAFAGKSNVGKSSLINAIMNRKSYAKVSATPGKTQTINFYNINKAFYLVDLPGYGYAKCPEEVKVSWGKMIERYLNNSAQLKNVFLLIDIRHKPSDNDITMYNWIRDAGFAPVIIATKSDKVKRSQLQACLKTITQTLHLPEETKILPFSALNREGLNDVYEAMDEILTLNKESLHEE